MKNDFVMPIVVLAVICLIVSGALAFTNSVTEPRIDAAAAERAEAARFEMIPEADGFEPMPTDAFPETVIEGYRSTNDKGYVFIVTSSGYGGEMQVICGIDPDGSIIGSKALEHSETKGLGSKITEEPFASQFNGMDSGLTGVSAISGATISTNAYVSAIRDAFTAFDTVA